MNQKSQDKLKEKKFSSYEESRVDECIKELIQLMRPMNCKGNDEFRITKSKIDRFILPLFKLYQDAFKQGVYVGK